MSTEITPEQIAEAKKNGLRVCYNAEGQPTRILSKEEIKKREENWDDEFCCPKVLSEVYRRAYARSASKTKKNRENT